MAVRKAGVVLLQAARLVPRAGPALSAQILAAFRRTLLVSRACNQTASPFDPSVLIRKKSPTSFKPYRHSSLRDDDRSSVSRAENWVTSVS
jgi:hypothetical protein